MKCSGIYSITHKGSGRKYIGSAINISKRWSVHKSHLNSGKHHSKKLQRSWDKYGENEFTIEILEEVINSETLISREQFYLNQIGNFRHSFNCNPTAGSSLGRILSAKTRRLIGKKAVGRKASEKTKNKMSDARKGKKKSAEHAAKLAEINRLRARNPISEETRKRMSESAKRRMINTPRGKDGRLYAFGADHDVVWSEKSKSTYQELRNAA